MRKTKQQRNFPTGQGGDPLLATLTEEKGLGLTQGDLEEMGDIGMKENLKRLEETDSLLKDPQFVSLLSEVEEKIQDENTHGCFEEGLKDLKREISKDLLLLAQRVFIALERIEEDSEICRIRTLLDMRLSH